MKTSMQSRFVAAILAFAPFAAQAAVTTYSSEAAFMAAIGPASTIDFEAQNPNGPSGYAYFNSITIGDVTFSQAEGRLFDFGQSYYATYGLTSSYLNQNCCAPSGIDVSFAHPIHAVGMNLGIQNTWNSSSLEVTFSLSSGDVITTTAPLLYGTHDGMAYFGFTSTTAITSFKVNGPSEGVSIDNFTTSVSAVPEPSNLAMLSLGLLGLGFVSRRKQG